VYHHLPKTGGTTVDALVAASNETILWCDPQNDDHKHCTPSERSWREQQLLHNKICAVGFRRLPFWLISNYEHKRQRMGLNLDPGPMKSGLFFRQKSEQWLPADWWLNTLTIDDSWTVLRCEHLRDDMISLIRSSRRVGLREHWRLARIEAANRNSYPRDLHLWFTPEQLLEAYAHNPRWSALETLHYGHLLDL
jgi:hypothetical protein